MAGIAVLVPRLIVDDGAVVVSVAAPADTKTHDLSKKKGNMLMETKTLSPPRDISLWEGVMGLRKWSLGHFPPKMDPYGNIF